MTRRILPLIAVFLFIFLAIDTITGFAGLHEGSVTKLIAVEVPTKVELSKFVESGLPAYALLSGPKGDYVVGGANEDELVQLLTLGLSFQILAEKINSQNFYIA